MCKFIAYHRTLDGLVLLQERISWRAYTPRPHPRDEPSGNTLNYIWYHSLMHYFIDKTYKSTSMLFFPSIILWSEYYFFFKYTMKYIRKHSCVDRGKVAWSLSPVILLSVFKFEFSRGGSPNTLDLRMASFYRTLSLNISKKTPQTVIKIPDLYISIEYFF